MRVPIINLRHLLWLLILFTSSNALASDDRTKTDVLVMKNGDRITCEIKALSKGQLQLKTAYGLGTLTFNWAHVERIESTQLFRVETTSGETETGTIRQESNQQVADRSVQVSDGSRTTEVRHSRVIGIEQLDQGFLKQLDGSVDVGSSYTSDNHTSQLSVNASVGRRLEQNEVKLTWSTLLNRATGGTDTNRYNGTAVYKRHLKQSKWYLGGSAGVLRSDQQNLKLRFTPGGGIGRTMVRTNRSEVAVFGGMVANREFFLEPVDGETDDLNAEGVVGSTVSLFRFDSTQLDTTLAFYPSITGASRYRIDFNTDLYLDLWGNLYLRFSFYDNFDSNPRGDTPKTDLGATTSIGWSF